MRMSLPGVLTAVVVAFAALGASAQEAPRMVNGPNGQHVEGSLTADGVTFSAEDLQSLVEAYRADPTSLPADLPATVRSTIYTLASVKPIPLPASAAPAAGGGE